jgi:glutaredoxin
MTVERELILYTRVGCHLCERAAELLRETDLAWRPVDIDTDPILAQRYGTRVPVIRHPVRAVELDYPFGRAELERFG